MKRTRMVLGMAMAVVLLASASAFAVPPAAPIQTPLSPLKIPQFAQPLDTLGNIAIAQGTAIDLSICEFQANMLPIGTPVAGALPGVAPATWVWGYQVGTACSPLVRPTYLGPAVLAARGTPTAMTYWNKLPNADVSNVKAYTTSTDQTLIWGDPLSLDSATSARRISGTATYTDPGPPYTPYDPAKWPEANECWLAAQLYNPLAVPPKLMPAACNNNYGFLVWPQAAPPAVNPSYPAPVPAAVHIHGGEVPSVLDGGPDAWWTSNGIFGHGYYSFQGNTGDAALGKATYRYPNGQEAAPVWFHDHMLGATRLNVYAGIAGAYVITEPASTLAPGLHPLGLADATWTPVGKFKPDGVTPADANDRPATELTIPLIIQDRMFDTNGQLFFPNVGINIEHPIWVPEFVGDVICVNGKAWPYLSVQPKRYKFLVLNGSNARAYELFFPKGPAIYVIGNDQGYLDAPQLVVGKLAVMPGERYEIIVDFAAFAGQKLVLENVARTPYVGGAPVNGKTTGKIMQFIVGPAAVPAVVDNSFNPAVAGAFVRANCTLDTNVCTAHNMVRLTNEFSMVPAVTVHKTRRLTLNEVIGPGGPLEVLVNNTLYDGSDPKLAAQGIGPRADFTPIDTMWNTTYYSELPHEGETEIWEIVNLTADAHPMHPHLVAFQVLNRQPLNVKAYLAAYNALYLNQVPPLPIDGAGPPLDYNCGFGAPGPYVAGDNFSGLNPVCVLGGNPDPVLVGAAIAGTEVPPMAQEIGWKDTVQALPNMITRILVRFGKPDLAANLPPDQVGYDFSPNGGHGYVWHCHIVDHEDNEMMRPFTVKANPSFPPAPLRPYAQGVDY